MDVESPEYRYELRVNGAVILTGDVYSTGVIFFNLHGRNFGREPDPKAEHADWLNCMEQTWQTRLPAGAKIQQFSPCGQELLHGRVGESFSESASTAGDN